LQNLKLDPRGPSSNTHWSSYVSPLTTHITYDSVFLVSQYNIWCIPIFLHACHFNWLACSPGLHHSAALAAHLPFSHHRRSPFAGRRLDCAWESQGRTSCERLILHLTHRHMSAGADTTGVSDSAPRHHFQLCGERNDTTHNSQHIIHISKHQCSKHAAAKYTPKRITRNACSRNTLAAACW
jgi:hypothetical protein